MAAMDVHDVLQVDDPVAAGNLDDGSPQVFQGFKVS